MKYTCLLPFNHMAVRPDGKIVPCCIYRWEDVPDDLNIFHPDPFNHPYMQNLRNKMSNDEYVSGCSYCYQDEETKGSSLRTQFYKDKDTLGLNSFEDNTTPELTYIDLSISNTCNNKCRMCGPALSSQWYSDAKKMNYPFDIPKGIVVNPFVENGDFSKLKYLKLLGGEPLLEQEKLIKILEQCDLTNLQFSISTNTTVIPNGKLHNLLKQCKKVSITLSIDSYGKLNEFLRKGTSWKQTTQTIDWFQRRKYHLYVHSVASIYNCNVLLDLINYCKDRDLKQKYVLIDGPDYMMPRNLPAHIKQIIIDNLYKNIDTQDIFKVMIKELSKEGNYKLFVKHDRQLNDIRKEHWKLYNPNLDYLLNIKESNL